MTTFSLAGKGLKLDTAADAESHLEPLASSSSTTSIDLSGNTLGVGACEALAKALLPSKNSLTFVDLHDIFTQRLVDEIPPALDAIVDSLLQCPNLTTVDLSDNAFGLKTKDPLVTFLSKHVPLKHLILNNNGMGPIAGTSIADALSELAKRKEEVRKTGKDVPNLESVVCGRNRLESGSMAAWAKAYTAHDKIRSIKMTQNGIRPEGIVELIGGLGGATDLEVFDLQDNTFTIKGAMALAKTISEWTKLVELGVGDDLLGARGSVRLFEALGKGNNKAVQILRLEYNDITSAGIKALLAAAEELPALRRVELNGNKFEEDDSSVEALGELLEKRKDEHGSESDPDGHWGLGDLDELEGEDEDEEEEELEDDEEEEKREKVTHDADLAEAEPVSQKKDADVDDLADLLDKTKV